MAVTREIPAKEWEPTFHALSERNQGRPVRLETTIPPGEGEPVVAEHRPLLGVEFDPKGSEAPAVTMTLGGLDAGMPSFTHVIKDPTRVWVEEELDGLAVALEVESREEGRTRLIFEPEQALPQAHEGHGEG